jgi:hypothetical protein
VKIPTEAKVREELLKKYREAVAYQIGVWEAALLITDILECDLELVLNQVSTAAALADTGMELTEVDLNDLFGIFVPGRVVIGRPGPSRKQIH